MGFRFSVERLAVNLGLLGWVKNLSDGRVELVCEGDKGPLQKLLQEIDDRFSGYVREKKIDWLPASNEFTNFSIRFF